MTIMPADMPLSSTGIAQEVQETVNEVFPLYASIQKLARLGVRVAFEVAPSRIVATITVTADAVTVLPALLEEIDDARPVQSGTGQLIVLGSMCERTVTMKVVIPPTWVSPRELAVLTGTADADPSDLL
ncbi:putative protein OS=Streptomyces fumanus OX=67302 GN=GCM10018772_70350 PE=4 SV=1 [Streptomyces fumanus]|uniref:Uncharacterized protein n=1 Tax=Streptomyces fumanus TaxID=67302 RepID=A0A919ECA1_9ACTN|nr:hypothetical protein [Streptomyces fumanus]GHF34743.1 hypothetical protein GCM10018772_70350 [Streptomyces fumanus]